MGHEYEWNGVPSKLEVLGQLPIAKQICCFPKLNGKLLLTQVVDISNVAEYDHGMVFVGLRARGKGVFCPCRVSSRFSKISFPRDRSITSI